jgi:hypothetical protein
LYFLTLLLPILLISCKEEDLEQNTSDQVENIDLSDCYSLNSEQCSLSKECKAWETFQRDDSLDFEEPFLYDQDSFCIDINSSPLFISCLYKGDGAGVTIDPIKIRFGENVEIYKNIETDQHIIINFTGWIGENKSEWELDQETLNDLVYYLETLSVGERAYPKYCE